MSFYLDCETKELEFWKYPELASSSIVIFSKCLEPTVLWKIKEPHNTGKDLEGGGCFGNTQAQCSQHGQWKSCKMSLRNTALFSDDKML
jgi:hypothetical protein